MTQVLIGLAVLLGYALSLYVKPGTSCRKCNGWGQKAKRRRSAACGRCKGTGNQFRAGALFVHGAVTLAVETIRERREARP